MLYNRGGVDMMKCKRSLVALALVTSINILWLSPSRADVTVGTHYTTDTDKGVHEYSRMTDLADVTVHGKSSAKDRTDFGCDSPGMSCNDTGSFGTRIECMGTRDPASNVPQGGWRTVSVASGSCWQLTKTWTCWISTATKENPGAGYWGTCTATKDGPTVGGDPEDIILTKDDQCNGPNLGNPVDKQYCTFKYNGTDGMTGDTKDDMFRLKEKTREYFEYNRVQTVDGGQWALNFIERDETGTKHLDLMVPSGPSSTYNDYMRFMQHSPKSVTVHDACYPVAVSIDCQHIKNTPPQCGLANGQTLNKAPTTDLCGSGTPSAVVVAANGQWAWQCVNNGSSVNCSASGVPSTTVSCGNYPASLCSPDAVKATGANGAAWIEMGQPTIQWMCYAADGSSVNCSVPNPKYPKPSSCDPVAENKGMCSNNSGSNHVGSGQVGGIGGDGGGNDGSNGSHTTGGSTD